MAQKVYKADGFHLKPGRYIARVANVQTEKDHVKVQYTLVKEGQVYKHGRPEVHDWPVFYPIDPNVTCKTCNAPWGMHGLTHGHCPPCMKEIRPQTKTAKAMRLPSYCRKISGHKGVCKP